MHDGKKRSLATRVNGPAIETLETRCLLSAVIPSAMHLEIHRAIQHVVMPGKKPTAPIVHKLRKVHVPKVHHTVIHTPTPTGVNNALAGTIISANTGGSIQTMVVAITQGAGVTTKNFIVTSTTTIMADGKPVTLADLNAGTSVLIQTSATSLATATAITAVNHIASGTVIAVDMIDRLITISTASGTSGIYSIDAAAKITIDGQSAALSAIPVGSQVDLTLSVFMNSNSIAIACTNAAMSAGQKSEKDEHKDRENSQTD